MNEMEIENQLVMKREELGRLEAQPIHDTYNINDEVFFKIDRASKSGSENIHRGIIIECVQNNNYVIKRSCFPKITIKQANIIRKTDNGLEKMQLTGNTIQSLTDKIHELEQSRVYLLYNVLTDELIQIQCDMVNLKKMIKYCIHCKYTNTAACSDDEFLKNILAIREKTYTQGSSSFGAFTHVV